MSGFAQTITASLLTSETGACLLAPARRGKYTEATNTGSNPVTGVKVLIALLQGSGISASTGLTPIDAAVSGDERWFIFNRRRTNRKAQEAAEPDRCQPKRCSYDLARRNSA